MPENTLSHVLFLSTLLRWRSRKEVEMEVYEAIEKRRTVRVFTKGVPEEMLRKLILAGTKAPSAGNRQPWEFIIVDDPEIIDQIAEHKYQQNRAISPDERALKQKEAYQNCSVVAVCHKEGHEQAVSAWMCIENVALAATAEGLETDHLSQRESPCYWVLKGHLLRGRGFRNQTSTRRDGFDLDLVNKIWINCYLETP